MIYLALSWLSLLFLSRVYLCLRALPFSFNKIIIHQFFFYFLFFILLSRVYFFLFYLGSSQFSLTCNLYTFLIKKFSSEKRE
jgi:hypothetical protein